MTTQLNQNKDTVDVNIDGELFTRYHFGTQWAKPFLYPVLTPKGVPITRGYPVDPQKDETQDHPHHKSIWVAYGDVNGADLWSEQPGHGTQVQTAMRVKDNSIVATIDWLDKNGKKLLTETRTISFLQANDFRAFDFHIEFHASEGDVNFGDTKEGGLISVRVATSMDAAKDGRIENSEGHVYCPKGGTTGPTTKSSSGEPTWGKRARWVTYTGPAKGATCGVTILDHPTNFRHPTYWHVRGYGLFTANPFGISYFTDDKSQDGSHKLKKGERLAFRYRVLIHDGALTKDVIEKAFAEYAK